MLPITTNLLQQKSAPKLRNSSMHTFLLSRASHLLIVWIKTSSLLFCCYHSHELSSCHNIWLTPTKSKGLLGTNSRLKKVTAVNTPSRFGSVEDTTSNIRVCCSHVNLTAPAVLISVIRPSKYPDVKYHRILYSIAAASDQLYPKNQS